jgi:hypothetical protein
MPNHEIPEEWDDQEKMMFARKVVKKELEKIGLKFKYGAVKCVRKSKKLLAEDVESGRDSGASFKVFEATKNDGSKGHYILIQIYALDFEDIVYTTKRRFEKSIVSMLKHELVHMFFKNRFPKSINIRGVEDFEETFTRWVTNTGD